MAGSLKQFQGSHPPHSLNSAVKRNQGKRGHLLAAALDWRRWMPSFYISGLDRMTCPPAGWLEPG